MTALSATFTGGGTAGNTFNVQCTAGASYTVALTSSLNAAPTTVYGTVGTPGRYFDQPNRHHPRYRLQRLCTSAMTTAFSQRRSINRSKHEWKH
ncbi:hypothetical protein [Hafnia alvei]|uniref:hypothetical protein n=1 Tax=Hafnia alvei TaxID=569 RepID=UPI00214CA811|nr:hypothetical protein [Hafnia alvei]